MLSERERNLELLLERVDVQRLESARLGANHAVPVSPCSAGPRHRASADRDRIRRRTNVAVAQRAARLREQLLEPHRVHARVPSVT